MVNFDASQAGSEVLPRIPLTPPPPQVVTPKVELPEESRSLDQVGKELFEQRTRAAEEGAKGPLDREEAERQLESLNKVMEGLNSRLEFGLYEGTDELFVRVLDRRSNSVIKVLPSEKLLELHAKLEKAMGLILDEAI